MAKQYQVKNTYKAAKERIGYALTEFDQCYLSFSGGKDSGVMLNLVLDVMDEINYAGKLAVLFIDLEGQYTCTIDYVKKMMDNPKIIPFWVCLPINLQNAVSQFQPYWLSWDKTKEDMWVQPMPENCINELNCPFPFFRKGMEFEEFTPAFGKWFANGKKTACLVGIRADESLNRFRTITSTKKTRYNNLGYTTRIDENLYNFYPIYDWKTEDIWTYNGKFNKPYNPAYDLMYLEGKSIHQMRLCQPYGADQRKGLDQFHLLEPETWNKVVARVSGANYGSIYCGDNLLGNIKVNLPEGHTWQSFTKFLLATMPPYARDHYTEKIKTFFEWWANHGFPIDKVPDAGDTKLESDRKQPSWRRIAKCLMKNDWVCKSLSFAQTKLQNDKVTYSIQQHYDTL